MRFASVPRACECVLNSVRRYPCVGSLGNAIRHVLENSAELIASICEFLRVSLRQPSPGLFPPPRHQGSMAFEKILSRIEK